ncbi:hypothetical protein JQR85_13610 [Stutzerimonas urumqiensis]|uniref:hypothetical protein n=1 Tax=Stutzerimonas urumqiensis TaxID=638269 RepID=UPI003DA47C44
MSHEHYFIDVTHIDRLDVYRLLDLFKVTCPVAQHIVKKALAAGQRGHKDTRRDWQDIADSAARRLQMFSEDERRQFGQLNTLDFDEARIDRVAASHGDGEHYAMSEGADHA